MGDSPAGADQSDSGKCGAPLSEMRPKFTFLPYWFQFDDASGRVGANTFWLTSVSIIRAIVALMEAAIPAKIVDNYD